MFIAFEEKDFKTYEVQNDLADEIFKTVKNKLYEIYESYTNNKEVCIAVVASSCVANAAEQFISDTYGTDQLIEILDAKEVIKNE